MKIFNKLYFGLGVLSLVIGIVLIIWQIWTAFHQFHQGIVSQEPAILPLLRYFVGLVLINLAAWLFYYSLKTNKTLRKHQNVCMHGFVLAVR